MKFPNLTCVVIFFQNQRFLDVFKNVISLLESVGMMYKLVWMKEMIDITCVFKDLTKTFRVEDIFFRVKGQKRL